jgi:hypothetical protein
LLLLLLEGVERRLRDEGRGLVDVVLLPACFLCLGTRIELNGQGIVFLS